MQIKCWNKMLNADGSALVQFVPFDFEPALPQPGQMPAAPLLASLMFAPGENHTTLVPGQVYAVTFSIVPNAKPTEVRDEDMAAPAN